MNKDQLQKLAKEPPMVMVRIHVSPTYTLAESAEQTLRGRQAEVHSVCYIGDFSLADFAKIPQLLLDKVPTPWKKDSAAAIITDQYEKCVGRPVYYGTRAWYVRRVLRFLFIVGIIDPDFYPTAIGKKILQYYSKDRSNFLDYIGHILLSKGGWTAMLTELDNIAQSRMDMRRADLIDELTHRLLERGLLRGRWSSERVIETLQTLKLIKQWDPVRRRFDVDWTRAESIYSQRVFQ